MIRALWRDGAVYAVGNVLSRGIALLLLPLLTRVLSPSDYGALDLIVTCGVLVNLVVPLESSQALARFWNERADGEARRRLAGTAWTFTLVGHAAFAVVCALASVPISRLLFGDVHFAAAVRAGACSIALNGMFYLLQNQFRWALRPRAYATASVGYALANLFLIGALAWGPGGGLERVLWAQAVAAAVSAVLSWAALRGGLRFGIDRAELRTMLRFSLPLVPAGIAVFASFYVNRLMLNAMGTLADVGLFGIANRLAGLVTLVLVGVQGALTPLIYAHHREPQTPAQLARLLEGFSGIALATCLALGLFGAELIALLATPAYEAAAPLLFWLSLATLLAQMYIFAPGIAIARKTHWQLVITLASAAVALALNALLIPRWGVWGATLATVAAGAVFFGVWLAASQRLYPLPLRSAPLVAAIGLFLTLALLAPRVDVALEPGIPRWLAKAGVLFAFLVALSTLGLLQPRRWRRSRVTAG